MHKLESGIDILGEAGGVKTIDEARDVLRDNLEGDQLQKLERIKTEPALIKIANAVVFCEPDRVFVNTGSPEDMEHIRTYSLERGEERPLAMPGHTVHFDLPQEQARIVDRTYYIVNPDEDVSVLGKKMAREEAHEYVEKHMRGIMRGKTMMVGFFSRGPAGAPLALPALEISSSTYVMHSADLLYRHCYEDFDEQVKLCGDIVLCNLHSEGPNRPEDLPNARVFMDRAWLTTFSMFCTYAGNTLLLKKGNHRFAVDLATYFGEGEELSEHMFITGMKDDGGRITWFSGAAPSGCGKTTTAMAGTDFVGDDLAQMWIAEDGTIRGINPEQGIFGIVKDVNYGGDPHLMEALRTEGAEVIFSNVLVDPDGKPRWTGDGDEPPTSGENFQGEWHEGMLDDDGNEIPMSHPNARCTVRCSAIENYNEEWGENPEGVPIRVVTYSGRDADTMPPVFVAKNADHGVVIGASIVSAATATEVGAKGVRRQPWANAPFIPGALARYMEVQFKFFNHPKLSGEGRPLIAGLNYFLTHEARGGDGEGLLGEKRDVPVWLTWLAKFSHGEVEGIQTPIGFIPRYGDLKELFGELTDKEYPRDLYDMQFSIYVDNIQDRIELQREAFGEEDDLPGQLFEVYDEWTDGLGKLKDAHGPVVKPEDLEG